MLLGIISDSHSNMNNVRKFINIAKKRGLKAVIHCGDVSKSSILREFENNSLKVYLVFGNMDNRQIFSDDFNASEFIKIKGEIADLFIEGKKIAFTHYPEIAENVAESAKYDAVFFGHEHKKSKKTVGKTLLCNPGELAGVRNTASYAIYDTEKNDVKFYSLQE